MSASTQPVLSDLALIVVGGSAGALDALFELLPALPPGFPIPLGIVLHRSARGPSPLAEVLGARCALPVHEVDDKQPIRPGAVYLGPPDYHLLVDEGPTFSLSRDELVHFSRPSIDVLFESAAATLGRRVVGVVLSGANADGAAGLAAICNAGGQGVIQAFADAAVVAMPEAAARSAPTARVLPLPAIGPYLLGLDTRTVVRSE